MTLGNATFHQSWQTRPMSRSQLEMIILIFRPLSPNGWLTMSIGPFGSKTKGPSLNPGFGEFTTQLRPELSLLTPGRAFRELSLGPLPDAPLNELHNYDDKTGNYDSCNYCTAKHAEGWGLTPALQGCSLLLHTLNWQCCNLWISATHNPCWKSLSKFLNNTPIRFTLGLP